MKKHLLFSILVICLLKIGKSSAQTSNLSQKTTFHIASGGGWDYLISNPNSNKLYVSHGTQVNILDKINGDSLGVIKNTNGVHGIAFINSIHKGYTSNGRSNDVSVFDLTSNEVITTIPTGENPDAIFYEPFSKHIITCNGKSKDLSIIDPILNKVIATIAVGGKPETAVSDNKGNIYVNIEDKNEVVKIDINNNVILNHWSIEPGEEPTGLAIDQKTKRLFVGSNKKLIVLDFETGKIVADITIGSGCDGVAFDSKYKEIYTSNGEGTMTVIKEINKNSFEIIETINTKKGARTIGNDASTHLIYLPTAEFEKQVEGDKSRPKMIPGTFQVLVFGK